MAHHKDNIYYKGSSKKLLLKVNHVFELVKSCKVHRKFLFNYYHAVFCLT